MERISAIVLVLLAACVDDPDELDELELSEIEQELDGSYFCVDHPCPDLARIPSGPTCDSANNWAIPTVKNIGTANAGASTTAVRFSRTGFSTVVTRSTPALNVNQSWSNLVALPSQCLNVGCLVEIYIDTTDVVSEISGSNNYYNFSCW